MGLGDYLRPLAGVAGSYLGWIVGGPIGGAVGWGLGMSIGGALFPAEAERMASQSLGPAQQQTPTANLGGVVPVVKGNRRIAGNLIWYDNASMVAIESEGGYNNWKACFTSIFGGTGAPGVQYYISFAIGVCIGPATVTRMYIGKGEFVFDIPNGTIYKINVGENVPVEYMGLTAAEILAILIANGATPITFTPPASAYTLQYQVYYGYQTTADPWIAASKTTAAPPYRNLCYVVFKDMPTYGMNVVPPISFEVFSLDENGPGGAQETDVTPQSISSEILTNEFYGMGLDPTTYLETTITDAAETYATTNDILLSLVFDNQRSILDSLQYIIQHHNGYIAYRNGQIIHGQLEIEGEEITWEDSTDISDDFTDNSTGTQWLKVE